MTLTSSSPIKVLLAPTWELAQTLTPTATVEAEYGTHVLRGEQVTLAHHVEEYRHCPAPCNADVAKLPSGSTIVISHIDLDTIGGVLALKGMKPLDSDFWEGAAFIDINGPHHIHSLSDTVREQLHAYWAWTESQRKEGGKREEEVKDVSDIIFEHAQALFRILGADTELIEAGKEWAKVTQQKTENCLIEESEHLRVFATNDVFTAASYYSPNLKTIASATVSYNTKYGSITLATSDESFVCRNIMQTLFGPEAGGHNGIAGTPRGQRMTLADLYQTVNTVREMLNSK